MSASGRLSQDCQTGILSVCFLLALLQHAHLDTNGIKLLKEQGVRSWFLKAGKSLLSIMVYGSVLRFEHEEKIQVNNIGKLPESFKMFSYR